MIEPTNHVRKRNRRWFGVLAFLLLGFLTFAAWNSLRPRPSRLLEQGQMLIRTDPSQAERLVRQALSSVSHPYPDAEVTLCRLLVRKGATDEATRQLNCIDLAGCRSDILLAFGRDALLADQQAAAYVALESLASRSDSLGTAALELLLTEYQEWGQDEKQLLVARELAKREPENAQRWSTLVKMLADMSRDLECVEAIHAARQHNLPAAMRRELQNDLVQRLINLGDIQGVRSELATLREFEADSVRVRGHQTYLYRMEGKLDQALETISTLLRDGTGHPYAHFTRGIVYLDMRRFADAAKDLERTLAAQPFNSAAEFKLSEAYRGLGQVELAAQHRKSAMNIANKRKRISELLKQRQTDARNPQLYAELAQLNRDLGDSQSARNWDQWMIRMTRECVP